MDGDDTPCHHCHMMLHHCYHIGMDLAGTTHLLMWCCHVVLVMSGHGVMVVGHQQLLVGIGDSVNEWCCVCFVDDGGG